MVKTPGRPGRKPRLAKQGQRVSLGLKVTPEIKNRLDAAAELNGRTQSQEAEVRLQQSFRTEDLRDQVLELAFGRIDGDTLFSVFGEILKTAAEVSRLVSDAEHWLDDPATRDAVGTLLRFLVSGLDESPETESPPMKAELLLRQTVVRAMTTPEWLAERRERLGPHAGLIEARVRKLQRQYEAGPKVVISTTIAPLEINNECEAAEPPQL